VGAHDLVEAGRQHVATGRVREAMACFKRAADDPERGAEALSLLAAAYLLPGSLAPDPTLAEELAGRAGQAGGGAAQAIRATARLRLGDLAGVRTLLDGLERASGPAVFWRRLVVEASAAGRLGLALAARRAMRRGRLQAPALPDILLRATAGPLFFSCLAAATTLALARPERPAAVVALGFLLLGLGVAVLGRRT
jgi:hypothetical protein